MQRLMPVPIPAYGKEKMALLNKKLLRGNDVPASISLTVNPPGSVPGLWISTLLSKMKIRIGHWRTSER